MVQREAGHSSVGYNPPRITEALPRNKFNHCLLRLTYSILIFKFKLT